MRQREVNLSRSKQGRTVNGIKSRYIFFCALHPGNRCATERPAHARAKANRMNQRERERDNSATREREDLWLRGLSEQVVPQAGEKIRNDRKKKDKKNKRKKKSKIRAELAQ